jgi:hypothetical protein
LSAWRGRRELRPWGLCDHIGEALRGQRALLLGIEVMPE